MKCPVCAVELQMTDRQGVEIDYCPQCRGVWLDRGELDKIIERSGSFELPAQQPTDRSRDIRQQPLPQPHRYDDDYYKRKKRKNFLDELFDF